jgi:hypothetical protein
MSRDNMPISTRNFGQPSNTKPVKRNREVTDSQVNLVLSDSRSSNDRNGEPRKKNLNNSRYSKHYEEELEVGIDTSTEKVSYKNFTGATHTSTVKNAIVDLADNSNDYSEDMDESVAFTNKNVTSDKENKDIYYKGSAANTNKCIDFKRIKKLVKTNRSDMGSTRTNPLNYKSNPKKQKGFVVNQPETRRVSYFK